MRTTKEEMELKKLQEKALEIIEESIISTMKEMTTGYYEIGKKLNEIKKKEYFKLRGSKDILEYGENYLGLKKTMIYDMMKIGKLELKEEQAGTHSFRALLEMTKKQKKEREEIDVIENEKVKEVSKEVQKVKTELNKLKGLVVDFEEDKKVLKADIQKDLEEVEKILKEIKSELSGRKKVEKVVEVEEAEVVEVIESTEK